MLGRFLLLGGGGELAACRPRRRWEQQACGPGVAAKAWVGILLRNKYKIFKVAVLVWRERGAHFLDSVAQPLPALDPLPVSDILEAVF